MDVEVGGLVLLLQEQEQRFKAEGRCRVEVEGLVAGPMQEKEKLPGRQGLRAGAE